MKRMFRAMRYSALGVFFVGVGTTIVGCSQEDQIRAILLIIFLFLSGGGAEEETTQKTSLPQISVGSTDFTTVDGNAICQPNNARINLSAQASQKGTVSSILLKTDAANTTDGVFVVRFMSMENTAGTTFQMNDHVDVSHDWDTCAAGCTINLPQLLTMNAGEVLACATNQTLSLTFESGAGSERLQTGTADFPNGSNDVTSDPFSSLGSNHLHLAAGN